MIRNARTCSSSDSATRRRAACDFLQALCIFFEAQVIGIYSQYIEIMQKVKDRSESNEIEPDLHLQEYVQNPTQNWSKKDACIFLVLALASKGETQKVSSTSSSSFDRSNLLSPSLASPKPVHSSAFLHSIPPTFYLSFRIETVNSSSGCSSFSLSPRIESSPLVNSLPLIKADCLKFLIHVRSQLDRDSLLISLPECVRYLSSNNMVVQTYAAHAIERLLLVRHTADPRHTA